MSYYVTLSYCAHIIFSLGLDLLKAQFSYQQKEIQWRCNAPALNCLKRAADGKKQFREGCQGCIIWDGMMYLDS